MEQKMLFSLLLLADQVQLKETSKHINLQDLAHLQSHKQVIQEDQTLLIILS
jgi:hypothetical protein